MMFRAQEPKVRFKVQEEAALQPGIDHIRHILNSVINKLNVYIINNKSKILDLNSDRSRDVCSIAMTLLGCVLQQPREIVSNILSSGNLKSSSTQVFSVIDLNEAECVDKEKIVSRFIEAMTFIKNYRWKTGYLGHSSLRDELNAAIEAAGYSEETYKALHQRYVSDAEEKKRAEEERKKLEARNRIENNANITRDYYKNSINLAGLKLAFQVDEAKESKRPGFFDQVELRGDRDQSEQALVSPNTYFLLSCDSGDDKKDPYFNVHGLLARCLKDKCIFDDIGVSVEYARNWYTLFAGSSPSNLISKIELNSTKYYMLGVSLEEDELKEMVVGKEIEAVLSKFITLSVSYMIDNEISLSQSYLLDYIKNKKQYKITERELSKINPAVNHM